MIISFPCVISQTVDKEILPYLLKSIERRCAVSWIPKFKQKIEEKILTYNEALNYLKKVNNNTKKINNSLSFTENNNFTKLLEASKVIAGVQVLPYESNKLNIDQPYFIIVRVNVKGTEHDFLFGFKSICIITKYAYEILQYDIERIKSFFHRVANTFFTKEFIWNNFNWALKKADLDEINFIEKNIYSKDVDRVIVLSANDLQNYESFLAGGNTEKIFLTDLKESRFTYLYIDDSLNKKIISIESAEPYASNIISYDMLYKTSLNILPELLDKAKERNTSLFSKKMPTQNILTQLFKNF